VRLYETTFILGPQADEATFDRQINAVSDVIKRYNGKVFDEDRIGIRRLAYPIRKYTQGYYARLIFTGDNSVLSELDRFYRLEEAYIRYLTVVFEGNLDEETGKVARPMPKIRTRPEVAHDDADAILPLTDHEDDSDADDGE
jgi:small subunit ribosomal protein S6